VDRRALLAALALLACQASAGASRAAGAASDEPVVLAAASLSDALEEIARGFRAETGRGVVLAFGGSGNLARQIQAGAPAEVFVSADVTRVDELERAGFVKPSERVDLLSNRLVVVVPAGAGPVPRSVADLARLPRLALADPSAAPAGVYARAWLERVGLWTTLRDRVVPTLDVRAALAAVATGSVPAAIVYRTDARTSPHVRVAFEAAAADVPQIIYAAALITGAGPTARAFFAHLRSPEARAVFRRLGFETVEP
jgi:molybdate transport system substrate-binding protein